MLLRRLRLCRRILFRFAAAPLLAHLQEFFQLRLLLGREEFLRCPAHLVAERFAITLVLLSKSFRQFLQLCLLLFIETEFFAHSPMTESTRSARFHSLFVLPAAHPRRAAMFAALSIFTEHWMCLAKGGVLFAERGMLSRRSAFAAVGEHGYPPAHQCNCRYCYQDDSLHRDSFVVWLNGRQPDQKSYSQLVLWQHEGLTRHLRSANPITSRGTFEVAMTESNHYVALVRRILFHNFRHEFLPSAVREPADAYLPIPVSERLAQCIWFDQRLTHDNLKLTDDRPLKVIDAGAWNLESGPDFLRATLLIGDTPPQTGDVEIHLTARDWRDHHHDRDPRYNNVILHAVMWEDGAEQTMRTANGRPLPQLILFPHLIAPLDELFDEIDTDSYPYAAHNHSGRCESVLQLMSLESLQSLLADAGAERLNAKSRRFLRLARRGGIEQAFYEGFMEALGYKQNKLPFRQLARSLPCAQLTAHRATDAAETQLRLEALLLGLAGLLPERELNSWDTASKRRAKLLWDYWWKHRDPFAEKILPPHAWNFANLRPANHPQRRIAYAAAFLATHLSPLKEISEIINAEENPKRALHKLENFLSDDRIAVPPLNDGYWHIHFRLGGKAQEKPSALLGDERATELLLNIILPALLSQSDPQVSELLPPPSNVRVSAIHAAIPRQPSHSLERYMLSRLFQSRAEKPAALLPSARHQQGLIQIFQDFCLNNTTNCQDCKLPELLNSWKR